MWQFEKAIDGIPIELPLEYDMISLVLIYIVENQIELTKNNFSDKGLPSSTCPRIVYRH